MNSQIYKEPTSDQCEQKKKIFEDETRIAYACWYPQMGGYIGKAVAVFDKKWKLYDHGSSEGGCVDVLIWHDGEFPFSGASGDNPPYEIHHCTPSQFISFGEFLEKTNNANMVKTR